MKLIIAGSRNVLLTPDYIHNIVSWYFPRFPSEVVSGHSGAVDLVGEQWATNKKIPIKVFPYPSEHGKSGGPIRNEQMAKYADALLAIWDGGSRGTDNMIHEMLEHKKTTVVIFHNAADGQDPRLLP